MAKEQRVVVTGMGVVSSVGIGCTSFFSSLIAGRSGIARITLYDPSPQAAQIAGEIKKYNPDNFFSRKVQRRLGRFSQFALIATREAIDMAQLNISSIDLARVGTLIGSGIGDFGMIEDQIRAFLDKGPGKMNPFTVPRVITNMASGSIAMEYGFTGPSFCTTSACASSSHAIATAYTYLKAGLADVIFAGGAESCVAPTSVESYHALRALSLRNDEPTRASRPFDKDRDGFVIAEGGAVLILETEDNARSRGAQILAEIAGIGMSCDAYHITASPPDGRGAAQAMNLALKDAGLAPQDIDYINAHGTATPINDPAETEAIKAVFKEHAYNIPVSSIKSMVGHSLGAAGAIEAVASICTIRENVIPPTINLDEPDPLCDLDYVPHVARHQQVNTVLSNSFGFGGQNCVLVFRGHEGA
ncbi:beta-ketoacyl-[acyl-carrier-protein] synthase II [candidate division KSB1 bacterium]|nr:beta-ketoacyl-ACP synthase II [candidate division KSB1 bacterium]RQW05859.1 MAG: beta-ketoacyl-[acyl-carrier-protein] synthase II [candidate division KSB1 bacterium]